MLKEYFNDLDLSLLNSFIDIVEPNVLNYNIKKEGKWTDIDCQLNNDLNLKIIMLRVPSKTWITFYFKLEVVIEQIEFMIFDDAIDGIDCCIRHNYYTIDNDILTTCNSLYTYLGNEYKSGGKSIRKVYLNDINSGIFYDNLNNMACTIDNQNIEVLLKEELEEEKPDLKIHTLKSFDRKSLIKKLL